MKYFFKIDAEGLKTFAEVGEIRPNMRIDNYVKDALELGIRHDEIKITITDKDTI